MVLVDEHWIQTCLIAFSEKGGSYLQAAALTDEITFAGEEGDMSIRTLLNGGNMRRFTPMTVSEVSFKIYPAEISKVNQLFYGDTSDVTQPLSVTNTLIKKEMKFVVTWVNDLSISSATAATPATTAAMRCSKTAGILTKCASFWTDNEQGFDVTIKFAPFNPSATGQLKWESTTSASNLPVVAAYT